LWTRSAGRRKTVASQLAAGEAGKVRREIARHAEFATTVEQIIETRASPGRCCLRRVPWPGRPVRRSHVAGAGGWVSAAMQAVSRRRI
jgi:hypothetical protein